jgi:signal transduction histidine kinase
MSLRTKLTLTHIIVALLAIVVVAVVLNRVVTNSFRQFANARALTVADQLADPIGEYYDRRGSLDDVGRFLSLRPRLLLRTGGLRTLVADINGLVVFDTQGRLEGQELPSIALNTSVPVLSAGKQVGAVAVVPAVGQLGELEDRFLTGINRALLLTSIIAGFGAALLGSGLALGLTRPLKALTTAAQQLGADRMRPVPALSVVSRDEVGRLTAAFNQMSGELARQEELRRQMVADIAHELRTPMSVLRMELEALEDGVTAPTPDVLASLREEVVLLNRLVDDLRLISLSEAGGLDLSPGEVAPDTVVERVATLSAARARQRGITVRADIPKDLPPVWADEQRLVQVLGNLVENALRYTPEGGTVTLSVQTGSVIPAAPHPILVPANWLVFQVSDTGPGIAAGEMNRIFERFYRTDRARARETGGTGLGLAIVRGLVHAMGGQVWAESPPGQGATLSVALPRAEHRAAPVQRGQRQHPDGQLIQK